jgi:hypothetical protein
MEDLRGGPTTRIHVWYRHAYVEPAFKAAPLVVAGADDARAGLIESADGN